MNPGVTGIWAGIGRQQAASSTMEAEADSVRAAASGVDGAGSCRRLARARIAGEMGGLDHLI
ncbi:hypothetical protein ACLOJK_015278 [Asimina triloba]